MKMHRGFSPKLCHFPHSQGEQSHPRTERRLQVIYIERENTYEAHLHDWSHVVSSDVVADE